jgi:desulfoferrodoxin (superoxide reductase-like protein)/DNA-directed RNA polymerase subunit RPC12/RpoP
MRYICVNCSYTFDESMWDREEWIDVATKIENIQRCPNCEEYDSFQWLKEEVNYAHDYKSLEILEIEHIPQIKAIDDSTIEVFIWASEHPMWEEHRISSISLFDEYWELICEEFLLPESDPSVEFDVSDLDEYEVVARCNIHWSWWTKVMK